MHRFLNAVAVTVVTGVSLSGCATQWGHLAETDPGTLPGDGAVITAAVFGSLEPFPIFTVQGLLEIEGEPVNDSLVVTAVIDDVSADDVIFETEPMVLDVVDGRFTRTINLPEAEEIAEAGNLAVMFRDADTGEPVGGALPITFTPRAWAAQYARRAGQADSATTAGVAGALSGDQSIEIELNAGFENYEFSYDGIRATRSGNMVHLSGLVRVNGGGPGAFATLPPSMHPVGRHIFSASANGQYVRVDVRADGAIQLLTNPSSGWFSLSGMSFPVAP